MRKDRVDGEDCYWVELGRRGKDGSFLVNQDDWDWYMEKRYSTTCRLMNGSVVTTVPGDSKKTTTVAKILFGEPGHRVSYINGNHKDLRHKNIILLKGKSGKEPEPKKVKRPIRTRERDKIETSLVDYYNTSGFERKSPRNARTGARKDDTPLSGELAELNGKLPQVDFDKVVVGWGLWADKNNDLATPAPTYTMPLTQQRKKFRDKALYPRIKRWGQKAKSKPEGNVIMRKGGE